MEWENQFWVILQILYALLLGGFIGFDREKNQFDAGIRTYAAVCVGAAVFTIIGTNFMDTSGASRMASSIIEGIGFLGAGLIFQDKSHNRVVGLTTAATVWTTAAVGVAIGYQLYWIALVSALTIYFLLAIDEFEWYKRWRKKIRRTAQEENNDEHKDIR